MNVYDALFMFQFFACVGIFLVLAVNSMRGLGWFGLDWSFLLFASYLIGWFVGFVGLANYPERLLYAQLFKLESWLMWLVVLFLVVSVFMSVKGLAVGVVERYESKPRGKGLYSSKMLRRL